MTFATSTYDLPSAGPRAEANPFVRRLQLGSLWLVGAVSGFVLIEPAPYEFMIVLVAVLFIATGIALRAGHLPLLLMLISYNIAYAASLVPVIDLENTAKWTAVSCFLSLTTLFYAIILGEDTTRRARALMRGYTVAAVVTSVIGVLAYFRVLPNSQTFIVALRASSTFKDPNVFGPFLILPALIALQRIMHGSLRDAVINAVIALIVAAALVLSFSRGAWGHFAASAAMMLFFTYVTAQSNFERLRIVIFTCLGAMAIATLVAAFLSIDAVNVLFKERASLVQSYDAGHLGRFNRHILGALMIFDHPLGVGPLQFNRYFPEDPHNSFLDAFMAGGWLGGVVYLALVLATVAVGFRHVFVRIPWQSMYIAVYAAFLGEVGESYIIDVEHWRHYYLIIGMIWGFAAAPRCLPPRRVHCVGSERTLQAADAECQPRRSSQAASPA
jgi:hypothetical protein